MPELKYFYAITDRPGDRLPAVRGLDDGPLCSITYEGVVAVLSPISMGEVPPSETNLWRHEAVVEALMADRTVLPVRFGTVLAGDAAVQTALVTHHADFLANLQRVRGRVELGVRVLWDGDQGATAGGPRLATTRARQPSQESGRTYMLARLEEERRTRARRQQAENLTAGLYATLRRLAVESTHRVLLTPRLLLTAAFLVEREQVAAFQRETERLAADHPALRFLCTGPWPPYNFVTTPPLPTDVSAQ